jgi:serine/threonine protein kinase
MLIGRGAYGFVYGNPRLPFYDEKYNEIKNYKQVTKIFTSRSEAIKEFNLLKKFTEYFKEEDLKIITDYLVLPIEGGFLNLNEMFNNEEIYSKKLLKYIQTKQLDSFVLAYPQGDNNLNEELRKISTFIDYRNYIKKSFNILEGIKYLLNNNFVHLDLKNTNMISIDKKFKIIDLTEVHYLNDSYKNDLPVGNMLYIVWPFTHLFTLFFINNNQPKIHLNTRIFLNQYSSFKKQNLICLESLKDYFTKGFDITSEMGFTEEEINKVKNIQKNLLLQKLYKDPEILNDSEKEQVFDFFENKNLELSFFNEEFMLNATRSLVKKFNTYFNNITDDQLLKEDLFKRTDIYSFGIFILVSLTHFLKTVKLYKIDLNSFERNFILELYNFINLSCYQSAKCIDINLIFQEFKKIIF